MPKFLIENDWDHGESLPFTIYRDGVAFACIVGQAELMRVHEDDERNAELIVDSLNKGALLDAIRAAVKRHDDRLNEGRGMDRIRPPNGDDYNAIFSMIMNGVPIPEPEVPVIKGEGFNSRGGGFAKIIVDGREFTPQQIFDALAESGHF